jgi:hypothetical protein
LTINAVVSSNGLGSHSIECSGHLQMVDKMAV